MDKKILDVTCGARTIWFELNLIFCAILQPFHFLIILFLWLCSIRPILQEQRKRRGWSRNMGNWTITGHRCYMMDSWNVCES